MNEPHRGYIDLQSMHAFDYNTDLHLGAIRESLYGNIVHSISISSIASALQSFMLGAGHPTDVGVWTRSFPMPTRLTGSEVLNPHGKTCWRADGPTSGQCIWEMHGVWGWDRNKEEAVVLREHYFVKNPETGKEVRTSVK